MLNRRKQQMTIILVLIVAIASVSIGFAAFSVTLNISSSATITPNSDDFNVVLTSTYDYIPTYENGCNTFGANYGGGANYSKSPCVDVNSVSGLEGLFTAPNQYVDMTIYAVNKGKYDAYLKNINFNNVLGYSTNVVCTPESGASSELVEEACKGISIDIQVNDNVYYDSRPLSGKKLEIDNYDTIILTIRYAENSARADGPFKVSIGDVSFDYSTVDNPELIEFSIGSPIYYAESNMTWEQWVNSEYNHDGYYCLEDSDRIYYPSSTSPFVKKYDSTNTYVQKNELINQNGKYYVGGSSTPIPV